MAIIQANTDTITYSDFVTQLCDTHAVDRTGLNERNARSAARFAYRDLPARHPWSYYYRQRILQTVASYSTGTVVFDLTGGTNELELTLTTGTWPSWAAYGRVIIDDVHYEVASRISSTVLTLQDYSNPGADVASSTYTIYRNSYPLPANFNRMEQLWDIDSNCRISFIDQRTQHTDLQVFHDTPGDPLQATIRATGKYLSGVELVFGPPPSSLRTYDMLYQSYPRLLAIDEYSNGTVSITAGTASVTGSSTVFPPSCAGSLIRFSDGPVKPSGYNGSLDGVDNPYVYQGIIKSRDSATTLTLEEVMPAAIGNLSGVGYTISDPLDIDVPRMWTALQRSGEAEFSRLASRQDASAKMGMARQALREAMENDDVMPSGASGFISNSIRRATVTTDG